MLTQSATRTPSGILVCRSCGKQTDCKIDNYLRFIREGWPECCGDLMTPCWPIEQASGEKLVAETPLDGTRID
jgi:hypothetical protein